MTTARVTQSILEVLQDASSPNIRVTQQVLEVMSFIPPPPQRVTPIAQQLLVTSTGTGTRVFPV